MVDSFSELEKLELDLFNKNFFQDEIFSLNLKSSSDNLINKSEFKLTAKNGHHTPQSTGSYSISYTSGENLSKFSLNTQSIYSFLQTINIENYPKFQGVFKLNFDSLKSTWKNSFKLQFQKHNTNGHFKLTNIPEFKVNLVTGNDYLGIGTALSFKFPEMRFTTYDAALWWKKNNTRLVLMHKSTNPCIYSLGHLSTSFFYKARQDTNLAGVVKYNDTKEFEINLGMEKELSETKKLKVRLDSDGCLGVSVCDLFSYWMQLSTVCRFNVRTLSKEIVPCMDFGVKIKLNF